MAIKQKQQSEPTPVLPLERVPSSSAAGFMGWVYLWLLLVGFIVFRMPTSFVRGSEMGVDRAIFATINCGTLTGFQQTLSIDDYKRNGQLMVLALTAIGSLCSLVIGGTAVTRIAKLPFSDGQIVLTSAIAVFLSMMIGAVTLIRPGQEVSDSILQGASAFGNSGVWSGPVPLVLDWHVHVVLLPLAMLGGLGIPVLLDLASTLYGRRSLSAHTWDVLLLAGGTYVVGTGVILACSGESPFHKAQIATASFGAINSRNTGLPILYAQEFAAPAQWIIAMLMLLGGSPGGTAGGLKGTTLLRLVRGVRAAFSGTPAGRGFGIAAVWTVSLLTLVALSYLTLLQTDPDVPPHRLLFIAISAATNTGMSHDRITIVGTGMYTLSITMVLGRTLPLVVLWWMARTCREEDMAVG